MNYSPYVYRLPPQAYTPSSTQALAVVSLRDLSREYIRLRGIAVKGGKRLVEAGYKAGDAFSFPTLTELKAGDNEVDPVTLQHNLSRLADYISNPSRTVSGRKKAHQRKQVESLQNAGYDFVTMSNLKEFGEYMDRIREEYGKRYLSSDEAATLFELAETAGIDIDELTENFDEYLENIEEAYKILENWNSEDPMSADEVRRRMGVD